MRNVKAMLSALPFLGASGFFVFSKDLDPNLYITSSDPALYGKMVIVGVGFALLALLMFVLVRSAK